MINLTIFSTPIAYAIGWTLMNSIWQGIIIGFLAGVFMIFIKNERPEMKYNIAVSALFFMFVTSVITFFISYHDIHRAFHALSHTNHVQVLNTGHNLVSNTPDVFSSLLMNVQPFLPFITLAWLFGVVIYLILITQDLITVHYLKSRNLINVSPELFKVFQSVAKQMNILKNFNVFESSKVRVPMVIGFLKPVILLPVGVFTGFSSKQIESIIAHELAHILRNDYLMNIVISFIKPLFFYHPVYWWFASIIEQEREKCCDDKAIAVVSDSLCYARSLEKLYEFNLSSPSMAMAAMKNNNQIFKRIKRITNPVVMESNRLGEMLLLALFIIGLCIFSANAQSEIDNNVTDNVQSEESPDLVLQNQPDEMILVEKDDDPNDIIMEPSVTNNSKSDSLTHSKYNFHSDFNDSLLDDFNIQLSNIDVKFDSIKFDSIINNFQVNFNHLKFDSLIENLDVRLEDLNIDMDSLSFISDSLLLNVKVKMDSFNFNFDMSDLKIDSLMNNFKFDFDSIDTVSINNSIRAFRTKINTIDFDQLNKDIKLMQQHLDSVMVNNKDYEAQLSIVQDQFNDPDFMKQIENAIENDLKNVKINTRELQEKIKKLNEEKIKEMNQALKELNPPIENQNND